MLNEVRPNAYTASVVNGLRAERAWHQPEFHVVDDVLGDEFFTALDSLPAEFDRIANLVSEAAYNNHLPKMTPREIKKYKGREFADEHGNKVVVADLLDENGNFLGWEELKKFVMGFRKK